MARSLKSLLDSVQDEIPGIIDDALENGVFRPISPAEIDDEIHAAVADREMHAAAYVHFI